MNIDIHPAVLVIKQRMLHLGMNQEQVATHTDIGIHRFRNLMAGRTELTLRERDRICVALDITPENIFATRKDEKFKRKYKDLDRLPTKLRNSVLRLCHEIDEYYKKK